MPSNPEMEQLLEHAAWLRQLAGSLVREDGAADDLVQDTFVAALRRPPSADRPLRPWLRRVITNVARFRWRGDVHRAAREQAVGQVAETETPSSEELLQRHETLQMLARLVAELEEPYRATVLLRYGEGLAPIEIARRFGIPAATVRTRLKEALERLRIRLDALHRGDRRAWVLALAPVSRRAPLPRAPIALAAFALVAVAAIAVIATWRVHHQPPTPKVALADPQHAPSTAPINSHGHGVPTFSQVGAPSRHVAGHVVVDGEPAAGARVRLINEDGLTGSVLEQRTTTDGRFDFGVQDAAEVIVGAAVDGRLAAIEHVELRDPASHPEALELTLDRCVVSLYGRVTDAAGSAIVGAHLLREDVIGTESDRSGNYELCMLPFAIGFERLRVMVRADSYGVATLATGLSGRTRHDFVLAPEATVTGRAALPDGSPVVGAKVWIELDDLEDRRGSEPRARLFTTTDEDGRFHLAAVRGGRHVVHAATRELAAAVEVTVAAADTRQVALRMLATGTVRGRVVRAGVAVASAHVSIEGVDGSDAWSQNDGTFAIDHLAPGPVDLVVRPYRLLGGGSLVVDPGKVNSVVLEVESLGSITGVVRRRGKPVSHARVCAQLQLPNVCGFADSSGRYAFEGLVPGAWMMFADDPNLAAIARDIAFTLAPGEHHELDVELDWGAHITGVVVDRTGVPVPDARVVFHVAHHRFDSQCITNATGEFDCGLMTTGAYDVAVYAGMDQSSALAFVGDQPPAIQVRDGDDHVDGLRLVIDPVRMAIHGLVVDASGAPLPDVPVRVTNSGWYVTSPTAISDRDGAFVIRDLARGSYELQARSTDGARSIVRNVTAGGPDVRIALDASFCADPDLAPPGDAIRDAIVHSRPTNIIGRPSAPIVWNHQVELVGWNLPKRTVSGHSFEATLFYRVIAPLEGGWKVFVHFDGSAIRAGLGDHDPIEGRCPSSSWSVGDYLVDHFTANLDAPPTAHGNYDVWIGLYRGSASKWENLSVSDAPPDQRDTMNRVKIATIQLD